MKEAKPTTPRASVSDDFLARMLFLGRQMEAECFDRETASHW